MQQLASMSNHVDRAIWILTRVRSVLSPHGNIKGDKVGSDRPEHSIKNQSILINKY